MGLIRLNGIRIYGYHGCLDEEAKIGGNYIVDVLLHADLKEAAREDKLSKTIDYVKVNEIVVSEMKKRAKLIENVGYRIAEELKSEFKQLKSVEVTVTKINPPIKGVVDDVSITVTL